MINIPHSLLTAVIGVLTGQRIDESVQHPMIDVDGQMKHRHNSLGQPIHHTDEGIKNFHRWFGDSKTVDEHGRPLVVYHGTPHYGFDAFDLSKFGERDRGDFGKGVYFSGNKIVASSYESPGYFNKPGSGDKTYSVYLKMESPLLHSNRRGAPDWIDREKHDSVWIHSDRYDELPIQHHKNISELVVLHPHQIKSVDNSGAFSHPTKITESEDYREEHPMIDVDGAQKHRLNSLGQSIHHTDEGIRNFHRWFGDSKAVDEHGRPQVLYHGTTEDFDAFDNTKTGKNDRGLWGRGHYFSTSIANANSYALRQGDAAHVMPTYVSLKSPLILKTSKDLVTRMPDGTNYRELVGENLDGSKIKNIALSNGHDGVIQVKPDGTIGDLVAYDPHQIKSAIGNTGAFSHPTKITESEDYREQHTSPGPDTGSPAHDLTKGAYPEDFYSSKGHQYYGDGRSDDKIVHSHLKSLRNRPEADVKIYRAVPNKDEIKDINPGDWVTTNLEYAKDHGELTFDNHKILTKNVKAKELFTDGSSYHEFGYHPVKQQHTMTDSVRQAYINMSNE